MTLCWCPWLCICSLLQFLATPSWSDPPAPSVVGGQDAVVAVSAILRAPQLGLGVPDRTRVSYKNYRELSIVPVVCSGKLSTVLAENVKIVDANEVLG